MEINNTSLCTEYLCSVSYNYLDYTPLVKTIHKTCNNGLYGLIFDKTKEEILPPIYTSINIIDLHNNIDAWFIIQKNNKYGLFQCTYERGFFCLNIQYDNIEIRSKNTPFSLYTLDSVLDLKNDNLYGIYSFRHGLIIPCLFDNIISKFGVYIVEKNKLKGAYNYQKELVPPIYDEVKHIHRNEFIISTNKLFGLMKDGQIICPPIYDEIIWKYDNWYNIIKGKLVGIITDTYSIIEPQYEDLNLLDSNYYAYKENGKWGIIDKNMNIIFYPKYNYISCKCNDYFIVEENGFAGIIDMKENYLIPPTFESIVFENNTFYGRKGRNIYIIDKEEKFIQTIGRKNNANGYDSSCCSLFEYDSNLSDLFASIDNYNEI